MALNRPRTEEEKKHQSEVMRGRITPPEVRAKISASMKKYYRDNNVDFTPRIEGLRAYHNIASKVYEKYKKGELVEKIDEQ